MASKKTNYIKLVPTRTSLSVLLAGAIAHLALQFLRDYFAVFVPTEIATPIAIFSSFIASCMVRGDR
jgi:hypothetical protein